MASLARLMIAGPSSGSGKTSVTCALLRCLQKRTLAVSAFKCGPDYIDPLFHREVLGLSGCNLDLFLSDESTVRGLLSHYAKGSQVAVIEGVMGYYDGMGGHTHMASSYDLARATQTPVVLLVTPKGMSLSLAAFLQGFRDFRSPSHIAGVIFNRCSASLHQLLAPIVEKESGLRVLGYLPENAAFTWQSRHLGLRLDAMKQTRSSIEQMAAQMESTLDMDGLLELAQSAGQMEPGFDPIAALRDVSGGIRPRIAVAQDEAFCFAYRENLDALVALGAEIAPFSPLRDPAPPEGVGGLYLPGGYPEVYAAALAENQPMRHKLRQAIAEGLPTVAECGGFLYLQQELEGEDGQRYPMLGLLDGVGERNEGLRRFGYLTMTARRDSAYAVIGESWRAHEFHHWDCDRNGRDFDCNKPLRDLRWQCGYAQGKLLAGFPHLYFVSSPQLATRFVRLAAEAQPAMSG